MKKSIVILSILSILSIFGCSKTETIDPTNKTIENYEKEDYEKIEYPVSILKRPSDIPDYKNLIVNNIINPKTKDIDFGEGYVRINEETDEYKIIKPRRLPDVSFDLNFSYIFNSIKSDPVYNIKSTLFPANKNVLFQIPETAYFIPELSTNGRPKIDKHLSLQIVGEIGKKKNAEFFICYKTVDHETAKFDFIVETRDDLLEYHSCREYAQLINNNTIKPLKFKENDFMLLRVHQFRAYAHGECIKTNPEEGYETCKLFFKTKISYYISD